MKNEPKVEKTLMQKLETNPNIRIDVETFPDDTEKMREAKSLMLKAASLLQPEGHDSLEGYAVAFAYSDSRSIVPKMSTVCLCPFHKGVSETQAGIVFNQLKNKMMVAYGRTPKGKI